MAFDEQERARAAAEVEERVARGETLEEAAAAAAGNGAEPWDDLELDFEEGAEIDLDAEWALEEGAESDESESDDALVPETAPEGSDPSNQDSQN